MGQERLLVDWYEDSFATMELTESVNGLVKFRGKFQEADAVNKNKRTYPFDVLDTNVKAMMETIKRRSLLGELDHPTDSIVHYANASHVITKLWWEGNKLMGEGEILPTPYGDILKALINSGVPIGISSRGVGSGKVNESGILVIGESYKLITFDAVADPSTWHAFQEKVVRRNESIAGESTKIRKQLKNINYEVKNESNSIDTVSKDELIACLGDIVKSQVEQYKARIS